MSEEKEIIAGECRIIRVEEVSHKGATITLSLLDFGDTGTLYPDTAFQNNGYGSDPIKKVKMKCEVPYGKTFELILREKENPLMAQTANARKIRTNE